MPHSFVKHATMLCVVLSFGGQAFAACCNTANGFGALHSDTTGDYNTADGYVALYYNATGSYNTATGFEALFQNYTGRGNTADGVSALNNNTSGIYNTASGYLALNTNNTGGFNSAAGVRALYANTSGGNNTAAGSNALASNTTGNRNSAVGVRALNHNIGGDPATGSSGGDENTASGYEALYSNTTGSDNTASGSYALISNTTGNNNTASGYLALRNNTTGSGNVAVGPYAGFNTTGFNNIDIGNQGVAGESGVIRIGDLANSSQAFIAGINISTVTGAAVYVNGSGQLGVLASSERYKTAIAPIGKDTQKLQQLRPVSFHLKADPHGAVQYGLIAEEVNKVYPELVIRDTSGKIQGVRYDELAPMLLSEAQQQQQELTAQASEMRDLKQQVAELKALNLATQVALRELQAKGEFVAER
jgi:trimeric autotransporter adhesin